MKLDSLLARQLPPAATTPYLLRYTVKKGTEHSWILSACLNSRGLSCSHIPLLIKITDHGKVRNVLGAKEKQTFGGWADQDNIFQAQHSQGIGYGLMSPTTTCDGILTLMKPLMPRHHHSAQNGRAPRLALARMRTERQSTV
jgi:hypothetical protein